MMKRNAIRHCPKCGTPAHPTVCMWPAPDGGWTRYVVCPQCDFHGPEAPDARGAVSAWNRMAKEN